jgi:RHS repeat-associated protein
LGNRVGRLSDEQERRYVRHGRELYCTTDGNDQVLWFHILDGRILYSLDGQGALRVYHTDARGNVLKITDENGAVIQAYLYDPYGNIIAREGELDNELTWLGARGVLAERNGLYAMPARFYDPGHGRFIREDPLGIGAGMNLYAYANGDPVNLSDPSGLQIEWTPAVIEAYSMWVNYGVHFGLRDAGYLLPTEVQSVLTPSGSYIKVTAEGVLQYLKHTGKSGVRLIGKELAKYLPQAATAGETVAAETAATTTVETVVAETATTTSTGLLTTLGTEVGALSGGTITIAIVVSATGGYLIGRTIAKIPFYDVINGRWTTYDQIIDEWDPMVKLFGESWKDWYDPKDEHMLEAQQDFREVLENSGLSYSDWLKINAEFNFVSGNSSLGKSDK